MRIIIISTLILVFALISFNVHQKRQVAEIVESARIEFEYQRREQELEQKRKDREKVEIIERQRQRGGAEK